ncbi:MAG: hypothetical protein IID30_14860, partial [Planctomycetes bacterium]|nr:hypothetical protein [Planctomycetota bacterium]
MHNQRSSSCIVLIAAAALTMWFLTSTASAVASVKPVNAETGGPADNYIELFLNRSSINLDPEGFILDMDVNLLDVVGVTGVDVTTGNGTILSMFDDGGGRWDIHLSFGTLAELITLSDGLWTVEVFGASPSISTFTVSSASLVEADLFPTPTGLSPAHGDVCVPDDATIFWNDPTGAATPDALAVCVFSSFDDMCDDSLLGSLSVTDTSWTPPAPMPPGPSEFSVFYVTFDETRVGPLAVISGAITWGNSPFVPLGYPASTPLLLLGSETIIEFDVASGPFVNVIELALFRIDEIKSPNNFILEIEIDLADVDGVTGVDVTIGDGTILAMGGKGCSEWDVEIPANSLSELITKSDGLWTLEIFGSSPSTSTFSLSTASLVEADIFPTATGLSPAQDELNVHPSADLSWNDPTGAITPDFLEVCISNQFEFTDACDDSALGLLSVTDTSWGNHPEMSPGLTDFELIYLNFGASRIGPLNVTSGAITWDTSSFAPPGYPPSTPLLLLGSVTLSSFTVADAPLENTLLLVVERVNDIFTPGAAFFAFMELNLPNIG